MDDYESYQNSNRIASSACAGQFEPLLLWAVARELFQKYNNGDV